MKSYSHLYEVAISEPNRRCALTHAKKSKRFREILKRRNLSDDAVIEQSKGWIANYENAKHTPVVIHDGTKRKERTIIVPTMEELLVQHCAVHALKPMFNKGMYEHTYASIPGRGSHKGKKAIEKRIKHDGANCKYVLKMDIRHFFDTIPHDILKAKLAKAIHDEQMLDLLYRIIDVTDVGLPLGFYTSQWLSNWYLQGLDHYIKEDLKAAHYIRYMDDMVIFGRNKHALHRIRAQVSDYLETRLGLKLKGNWQVYRFSYVGRDGTERGRDLDFMGFRFFRGRTTLRKSIMLKATRKAGKLARKKVITIYDARQMLSYFGWLKCTDTHDMYLQWIMPKARFRDLRQIVSEHDKKSDSVTYQKLVEPYTAKGVINGNKLQVC
jgi:RNA-directed DNA polymerase